MPDILDALLAAISQRISGGSLTLTPGVISTPPFSAFVKALPQSALVLDSVPQPVVSSNPDGTTRTLTVTGKIPAGFPVPRLEASLVQVSATVTVTARIGAVAASWATLTVVSGTLTPSSRSTTGLPGLRMTGRLTDEPMPLLALELLPGSVASAPTLKVNDAASAVTAGVENELLPAAIRLGTALMGSLPVCSAALTFGMSDSQATSMSLGLSLGSNYDVLGDGRFRLVSPAVTVTGVLTTPPPGSTVPVATISGSVAGTLELTVAGHTDQVAATLTLSSAIWKLTFVPTQTAIDDALAALATLAGLDDTKVAAMLAKVGVENLTLVSVSVSFEPLQGVFERLDVVLGATFFGGQFFVTVSLPTLTVSVAMSSNPDDPLHQSKKVSLSALVNAVAHDVVPITFPQTAIYLDGFSLFASPQAGDYALSVQAESQCTVTLAGITLALQRIEIDACLADGVPSGSVRGTAQIRGVTFELTAAKNAGAGAGWTFGLMCADGTPTEVIDLLDALESALEPAVPFPGLPVPPIAITLRSASVEYDTATSRFAFNASAGVVGTVLGKPITFDGTVSLATEVPAGGASRTWELDVALPWTVGSASFFVGYTCDSGNQQVNVLTADWIETGGAGIKVMEILEAFGFSPPAAVSDALTRLNLQLDGVYFEYDFGAEALALAARTSTGSGPSAADEYVLLQVGKGLDGNSPAETQILVGVALQARQGADLDLTMLPAVGRDLSDLRFISVDSAAVIVSSVAIAGYVPPSLPFYGDSNPFGTLAAAGRLSLAGASGGAAPTVTAAGTFSLRELLKNPSGPAKQLRDLGQLVGDDLDKVPAALIVQGSMSLGANPSFSLEVDLQLDLSIPVTMEKATTTLVIQSAGLSLLVSEATPFLLVLTGAIALELPVNNGVVLRCIGGIAISTAEIEGFFSVVAAPPIRIPALNLYVLEAGVELGITLAGDIGLDIGVEGQFTIGPSTASPYEIAAVASIEAAVPPIPNLNCLVVHIPQFSFTQVMQALAIRDPPPGTAWLNAFALTDVYLAWAEEPGYVLPDGTAMTAGFQFNGALTIVEFSAWVAICLSPGTGEFSASAQCSPLSWNGLGIRGKSTSKTVTMVKSIIDGRVVWQPQMTTPLPPNAVTKQVPVVTDGGPIFALNAQSSPYVDADFEVVLFGQPVVATQVVVAQTSITFHVGIDFPYASDSLDLSCTLGRGQLSAGGSVSMSTGILGDIPFIAIESFSVSANLTISESEFLFTVTGSVIYKFWETYTASVTLSFGTPPALEQVVEDLVEAIGKAIAGI